MDTQRLAEPLDQDTALRDAEILIHPTNALLYPATELHLLLCRKRLGYVGISPSLIRRVTVSHGARTLSLSYARTHDDTAVGQ